MSLETDGCMYAGNTSRTCDTYIVTIYTVSIDFIQCYGHLSAYLILSHTYIDNLSQISHIYDHNIILHSSVCMGCCGGLYNPAFYVKQEVLE